MRFKSVLAATGFTAALAVFLGFAASAQAQSPGQAKPICANCHEQSHESIALTAHGAKNDANGSMCQACHGDASAHLQDPMKNKMVNRLTKKTPAAERAGVCLTCHAGNRHLSFWEAGKHAKNDIACSDCHSIHGKVTNPRIAPFTTTFRENESDMCGTCHQQIRSATLKPSHHPIQEGKIKCSDCHNPHGALSQAMVKQETVNQQCQSCHADKRGPYVFAHPAVEDNCLSCHNPHGSSHAKLLNEKVPNLCQDCHDWSRHPGTYYDGKLGFVNPITGASPNPQVSTRFIARGCLNCHNSIHGSNAPGNRGKFLTR
jgi:DmsE family decaheme c-type cytochrome